jgi:outer membrane protein assembly factor BamB
LATLPRRVASFNPANGNLNWICGGAAPLAYASPMESEGTVVGLGGYGGASLAVRGDGEGNVTDTQRLWHKSNGSGWLGTGVIEDGAIYAADMSGVLSCRDVETGDVLWKERTDAGSTWSSITQDKNGLMFLLSKSGTTTVFRPNKETFDLVATNPLGEDSNATVVIAGDDILIRTDKALWSIGK